MHKALFNLALVSALALSGASALAQSGKKSATGEVMAMSPLPECPSDATGVDSLLQCQCPQGGALGSVWGSGPYTADSSICAAATHAGVIGVSGGALGLTVGPGQSSYSGSTQNGVTTQDWGSYGKSFTLVRVGARNAAPSGLPGCGTMPGDAEFHSCSCPAEAPRGAVWGSGPYTSDSDICTAARHAGYIDEEGGDVRVIRVTGLSSYTGQESFGMTSSDWGAYDSSIVFDWN